ncbi:MAG: hydantoinase/oxoprolinase family protein [Actinomycetota bacterium]
MTQRVAVDIGGTFTDLAAVDDAGRLTLSKADTTPSSPDRGAVHALERSGVAPADISTFVHGTTVVINAVTERKGATTALLTTEGFRDILEMGRANRPDLYNLAYRKPRPFVPRRRRFEVAERLDHHGRELTPLDEAALPAIAARIRGSGAEALAICFLHAWVAPEHERRAAEVLRTFLDDLAIVCSHEVSGEWREFERSSTAVLSAYVKPVVGRYLAGLEATLRHAGVEAPLYAMRSAGGVASFARATANPITLLESGPVAGIEAAAEVGRRMGARHVLALDIGGTTAKASAVRDGTPAIETLYHLERTPTSAGYPIQVPVVQIVEIGAGGGSIAWVDEAGGLHVGPRSAGAEPGPACYGRGGTDPTITDANLVAGRLDPAFFLGGAMTLDLGAAHDAMRRLGAALETDARTAARGVLRFAIAQMAHALRLVTLRRGHDPRDFTFVAFGGAGPLHATLLARELGIERTVIPPAPGHFSAVGMLHGRLRADAVRTRVGSLRAELLGPLLDELETEAAAELGADDSVQVQRFAQLRYAGQEHTLEVPIGAGAIDVDAIAAIRSAFDRASEEAYAFSLDQPVDLVAARVAVAVASEPFSWRVEEPIPDHRLSPREVDLDDHGGVQIVRAVHRGDLREGEQVRGPLIVEEAASTTLVLPGQTVARDTEGNLSIEEVR